MTRKRLIVQSSFDLNRDEMNEYNNKKSHSVNHKARGDNWDLETSERTEAKRTQRTG